MESLDIPSSKPNTLTSTKQKIETPHPNNVLRSDHLFRHTNSLEILRETVRILRCNPATFIAIGALLIYPVSALHLSNLLTDQSTVERVTKLLLFTVKSCGLPSTPFLKASCKKFSEAAISSMVSFPLYCTLLLTSKAAVVYSVESAYSRKNFVSFRFFMIMRTIWRRIISTYLLISALIAGCITLFLILLICVSRMLLVIGFSHDSIACIGMITGLFFLVFLAHTIIICDLSVVISVWEDVSGLQALLRSSVLIRGQTRVGLMIFLGSTIGMWIVKGLFEHRVKILGYGVGSSRIWERPVLVLVYSFVVLVEFTMSTVFFFSCKSYGFEAMESEM